MMTEAPGVAKLPSVHFQSSIDRCGDALLLELHLCDGQDGENY